LAWIDWAMIAAGIILAALLLIGGYLYAMSMPDLA